MGQHSWRRAHRRRNGRSQPGSQITIRLTVILNPTAGFSRAVKRARHALDRLDAAGIEIELQETEYRGHATELARRAVVRGRTDIAAVGGDGTAYEVLNGLLPLREGLGRPRLAIVPVGTGNSLMNDLTDRGASTVVEALEIRRTRTLDVFHFQALTPAGDDWSCHLLGNLSLGFPAEVVELTYRRFKRLGAIGYTFGFVGALSGYTPIEIGVQCDGETELQRGRYAFLAINNNPTFGGNMKFAPQAEADDGLADLFLIDPVSRIELLKTFPKIYRGSHMGHPAVNTRRATRVDLECDGPLPVLIDGELERLQPKSLEVLPQAIDLFV